MEFSTYQSIPDIVKPNAAVLGDCLEVMSAIPDESIDFILADLPYGTTIAAWDEVIPFEPLWEQFKRVAKPTTAMVFTASQPFTTQLITSNLDMFRYCLVWQKTRPTGSVHANKRPLKAHEDIVVFYQKQPTYNPQMTKAKRRKEKEYSVKAHPTLSPTPLTRQFDNKGMAYPRSILEFANPNHDNINPTQKPVPLFEYLIQTYSNEGDTILDPCAGSFTTSIAADKCKRSWICIEKSEEGFETGMERLKNVRYTADIFDD